MTSLIPSPNSIHDAVHICIWFMFISLAIAVHAAQAEEGKFAPEKNTLTNKVVSSNIRRQLPYQFNTNIALNAPNNNTLPAGNGTPRLSFFSEPKEEDGWSINIQKQAPLASSNCAPPSPACFNSNNEQPNEVKPQQESFWFVLRKAFHF